MHLITFSPDDKDDDAGTITTIEQHEHVIHGKLTREMREYLRPFILDVKPLRACFLLRKQFPLEGPNIDSKTIAEHKKYIKKKSRTADYRYDLSELRDWVTNNRKHVLSTPDDIVSLKDMFIQIATQPVIEYRKKYNASHFRTVLLDTTFKLCTMRNVYCIVESSIDAYQRHVFGSVTLTTSLETRVYEKVLMNIVAATGLSAKYTVSDGETAIANAFKNVFPGSRHITCLFHRTFGLMKTSARYEKLTKLQMNALSADVSRVCKCSSRELFDRGFEAFMEKWSVVEPDVRKLFASEFDRLYEIEPGVPRTTACLEKFNLTLKDGVTDHKYLPIIELVEEIKDFLLVMESPKLKPPPTSAYTIEGSTPKHARDRLNHMHRAANELVANNHMVGVSTITSNAKKLAGELEAALKDIATTSHTLTGDPLNVALMSRMVEQRSKVISLQQKQVQNTDRTECVRVPLKDAVGDTVWFDNPDFGKSVDPVMKATVMEKFTASVRNGCNCDEYIHYAVCQHSMAFKIVMGTMDTTGYSNISGNERYSGYHRRELNVPPALVRD